ncbi:hypothetical protein HYG86_04280 [Alkalicella caledoniensis]|uniref:Uncharacterized protein n=1 Tax=Alkalicella caledoniensis TaxID=2731377 RepID=A0A7G9W5T3_ALKCA|nr:hypothetical protein [Alkalicella caledoniensis]QNO14045.1 hypothetical protein HYG86_04280 [Alkalicella caledoniensis]
MKVFKSFVLLLTVFLLFAMLATVGNGAAKTIPPAYYGEEWTLISSKVILPMQAIGTKHVSKVPANKVIKGVNSTWKISAGESIMGHIVDQSFLISISGKSTFKGPNDNELLTGTNLEATHAFITAVFFGELVSYTYKVENKITGELRYETYNVIASGDILNYYQRVHVDDNGVTTIEDAGRTKTRSFATEKELKEVLNSNNTDVVFN